MPPVPTEYTDISKKRRFQFGPVRTCVPTLKARDLNCQQNETENVCNKVGQQTTTKTVKRSADQMELTPSPKRRCQIFTSTPRAEPEMLTTSPISNIVDAVEKLSTEPRLVADGSRENILPKIPGKHRDLSAISPETMSDVLDGVYDDKIEKVTIIDCRYPYEYNGGHIKGAMNFYTKETIQKFLQESVTSSSTNHVLIFHCEFSSERGPKMYRFLRSLDRDLNKNNYPCLNFPEIYLLEGGYKAFFYSCKDKCILQAYTPMLHNEHKDELRHFRVKSKSWSAGDRPKASIAGTGMRLRF